MHCCGHFRWPIGQVKHLLGFRLIAIEQVLSSELSFRGTFSLSQDGDKFAMGFLPGRKTFAFALWKSREERIGWILYMRDMSVGVFIVNQVDKGWQLRSWLRNVSEWFVLFCSRGFFCMWKWEPFEKKCILFLYLILNGIKEKKSNLYVWNEQTYILLCWIDLIPF